MRFVGKEISKVLYKSIGDVLIGALLNYLRSNILAVNIDGVETFLTMNIDETEYYITFNLD